MPSQAQRHSTESLPESRPLTVGDVMTRKVVTVTPDAPVSDAIALLSDAHVSGLAVVNAHHLLVGVISAQDVLAAEAEVEDPEARDRMFLTTTVQDLMSTPPHVVGPDLELRQAALEMEYGDVHRVFVIADGKVVGVLSRSDVNRAFAQQRK